jgi:uncharacterized Zn finger protein
LFSDEVDSLNMAQWDDVNKMWRSSDVANVKFDLSERSVSFVIKKFCPLAVMTVSSNIIS